MAQLQQENATLRSKAEVLEDELRLLKHKLFGRRSEKLSAEEQRQASLFDEAEWIADRSSPSKEPATPVRSHLRRPRGRKPLPASLPREEVLHDIPEEEKICRCGATLVRIGEETSEQLEVIAAQLKGIRPIRPQYACRCCDGAEGQPVVKIAPAVPQIIPKSIATAGLLAYLLVSTFADALPFYRQEKLFARIGVELSRVDFSHWAMQAARACDPLLEGMLQEIRSGPVVLMDETRVQVMKELGRVNTAKSYMWVMRGGPPEHPLIVYRYHPTRSERVPLQYLSGYVGHLQTDGYDGYSKVGALPGIGHAGCWAHARRKFDEAAKASQSGGAAREALERIAALYPASRTNCGSRSWTRRRSCTNARSGYFRFYTSSKAGWIPWCSRCPPPPCWAGR